MARLTTQSYVKIGLIVLLAVAVFIAVGVGGCASWRFDQAPGASWAQGGASVDASGIKNIAINWAAGSVDVSVGEGDRIQVAETSQGAISKGRSLRWTVDGNTLKVDYGSGMSCLGLSSKHLEVTLPRSLAGAMGSLDVEGATGVYRVEGITCDALQAHLASGKLDAHDVNAAQLSLEAASGMIDVQGDFADSVSIHVASGEANVTCAKACPKSISAEMATGKVTLAIPDNTGFSVKLDKLVGSFNSDFPLAQQGDNRSRYGNGAASFNFDIATGSLTLRKAA